MRTVLTYAAFLATESKKMTEPVQLLGISNAIVDILAHVDSAFLEEIGAPLGSMTLIDERRAHEIYAKMGPATEMSGGSVANTIAGFANLGGSAAYIGRVRNDQLGEIFVQRHAFPGRRRAHQPGEGRLADCPLPRTDQCRRATHDADLPRRLYRARRRRHYRRDRRQGAGNSTRRLCVGYPAGTGAGTTGNADRGGKRFDRGSVAIGFILRRTPPRRLFLRQSTAVSTSCLRTKTRSWPCSGKTPST